MVPVWGLFLVSWVVGEGFIEPQLVGNVEYYDNGDDRYGIVGDRVSFEEAILMCGTMNGSLLELTDSRVGDFIGRALAESAIGFTSLWVGGKFHPGDHRKGEVLTQEMDGVWRWLSGPDIDSRPLPPETRFPMTNPPYWLDRPDPKLKEFYCLVLDRNAHHRPLVTGLPCEAKRPFICTLPPTEDLGVPVELLPEFNIEHTNYHLFQAKMTWSEALTFCQSLGFHLAVINKQEVFTKLQHRMRRHRPIMESAWIGGVFRDGRWVWVNNKPIPTPKIKNDRNRDKTPEAEGEGDVPWYRPDNVIMDGCLLADRHLCDYFVFVEAKCSRRRNVLCELATEERGPTLVQVPHTPYFISQVAQSWADAQRTCRICLGNSWGLLELNKDPKKLKDQAQWTYLAMTIPAKAEIRHIWMNGKLFEENFDGKFTWGRNFDADKPGEVVDPVLFGNSSTSLLSNKGDDGFIVFCPGDYNTDPFLKEHRCLNMDRENQKHFFMYGLKCHFKQHFICMPEGEVKSPNITMDSSCTEQLLSRNGV